MTTIKSARQKGKDLENYIADQIRAKGLDPKATRSIGSGSGTREKSDIDTNLTLLGRNVGIEAKNQKTLHIQDWFKQAEKLSTVGREPILVYKVHNESLPETKAVIYLDTLLDLIKRSQEPKTVTTDDRDTKWAIENVKTACQKLLKRI